MDLLRGNLCSVSVLGLWSPKLGAYRAVWRLPEHFMASCTWLMHGLQQSCMCCVIGILLVWNSRLWLEPNWLGTGFNLIVHYTKLLVIWLYAAYYKTYHKTCCLPSCVSVMEIEDGFPSPSPPSLPPSLPLLQVSSVWPTLCGSWVCCQHSMYIPCVALKFHRKRKHKGLTETISAGLV